MSAPLTEKKEGNLAAPTRHPVEWRGPEFYDEAAFFKETERVFDICGETEHRELIAELVADPWSARPDKPSRGPGRNAVLRRVRWAERRVADEWRQGPDREEDEHVWMHRLRRRAKAARYAHESITAAVPESQDAAAAYAKVATLLGVVLLVRPDWLI